MWDVSTDVIARFGGDLLYGSFWGWTRQHLKILIGCLDPSSGEKHSITDKGKPRARAVLYVMVFCGKILAFKTSEVQEVQFESQEALLIRTERPMIFAGAGSSGRKLGIDGRCCHRVCFLSHHSFSLFNIGDCRGEQISPKVEHMVLALTVTLKSKEYGLNGLVRGSKTRLQLFLDQMSSSRAACTT